MVGGKKTLEGKVIARAPLKKWKMSNIEIGRTSSEKENDGTTRKKGLLVLKKKRKNDLGNRKGKGKPFHKKNLRGVGVLRNQKKKWKDRNDHYKKTRTRIRDTNSRGKIRKNQKTEKLRTSSMIKTWWERNRGKKKKKAELKTEP